METQQKRNFSTLMQDKRFQMSLPIFVLLIGGLTWYSLSGGEPQTQASNINASVPLGTTDSTNQKNRLDLQGQAIEEDPNSLTLASGTVGAGQTGGLQANVPGQTEKYIYGRRFNAQVANVNPTVGSGAFAQLDSTYIPNRTVRRSPGNSMPSGLKVGGPGIPLTEREAMMPDDQNDSPRPANTVPAQMERSRSEYQAAMKKQEKLTALLEEYKRDKENKRLAEEDKKKVYKAEAEPVIGSLNGGTKDNRNSFYGLYTEDARKVQKAQLDAEVGTIRAMIFGDQDVVSSGRVKMRLLEKLIVRGITLPEGSIIYGVGGFSAERVTVRITALQFENHIFPVSMTVFDMDGMAGIYVPNIMGLQEARQALGQVPGNINLNTGVSSVNVGAMAAASAAQAGIQGVRQITTKKTTVQRAHLKNNYYVLLRSNETSGIN